MRINRKENTKPNIVLLNFGTNTNVYHQFTMMLISLLSSSVLSAESLVKISYYVLASVS
jgi:hypothetical protein